MTTTYRNDGLEPRNSIGWFDDRVRYIDQRLLPHEYRIVETDDWQNLAEAIRTLAVRGAPLIGISAAYAIALAAVTALKDNGKRLLRHYLLEVIGAVGQTRPTAVNLQWSLDILKRVVENSTDDISLMRAVVGQAKLIHKDDRSRCNAIAENGQELVPQDAKILTVCNTGFLATGGEGTAAAIFYKAHDLKKNITVFAPETRPLLQGARLTVWEMKQAGIPVTLMADSAAAGLVRQGKIDVCIIGADRIAANGDAVNKIGSYQLALACKEHDVPFYVAAPVSTIDPLCSTGVDIPIERRSREEITHIRNVKISAEPDNVYNPAFDLVPAEMISRIVTERGVHKHPYTFTINSSDIPNL